MKRPLTFSILALFLYISCSHPPGENEQKDVIAFVSTSKDDLPSGIRAEGRVGDIVMKNSVARFVIQQIGNGVRYAFFGGNLIDAEPISEEGIGLGDRMMEIFPMYQYVHTPYPEEIEIENLDDRAIVHVRGSDYYFDLTDFVSYFVAPLPVTVETTYTLLSDSPFLEIETTFTNIGEEELEFDVGDALGFGKNLEGVSPGETPDDYGAGGIFSMSDGEACYLYLYPEGTFNLIIQFGSLGMSLLEEVKIPPEGKVSYTRLVAVSEGGTNRGIGLAFEYLGKSLFDIGGYVVDTNSLPVEGAKVHIYADDKYFGWSKTNEEGKFVAQVLEGRYTLIAEADGRESSEEIEIEVGEVVEEERAEDSKPVILVVGEQGCVEIEVVGDENEPIPFRLTAVTDGGGVRDSRYFYGKGELCLIPDYYDLYISRGPEYSLETLQVDLIDGGWVDAGKVKISRQVDTTGFIAGDFHMHTINSPDSDIMIEDRVLSLAGEGIEWAVSSDHDVATDYTPTIEDLGLEGFLLSSTGEEVSPYDYGHFNPWPLDPLKVDPQEPLSERGAWKWIDVEKHTYKKAEELFSFLRETFGKDIIIQVNHPRCGVSGYFDTVGFDGEICDGLYEEVSFDFETFEVRTEIEGQEGKDWFDLLNCGIRKTATGVSDAHELTGIGYSRTLVASSTDDPLLLSEDELIENLKQGRAVVSCGLFTTIEAEGENGSAEVGETLTVNQGERIIAKIKVYSPDWINISLVSLFRNGVKVPLKFDEEEGYYIISDEGETDLRVSPSISEKGGFEAGIEVIIDDIYSDLYLVALAKGGGSLWPINSCSPIGYTNPVFIEVGY